KSGERRSQWCAYRLLRDPAAPRTGRVDVTLRDARTFTQLTKYPPGTKENPLDTATVTAKARELMLPVIGASRTDAVIERVNNLEKLRSIRELAALLAQT